MTLPVTVYADIAEPGAAVPQFINISADVRFAVHPKPKNEMILIGQPEVRGLNNPFHHMQVALLRGHCRPIKTLGDVQSLQSMQKVMGDSGGLFVGTVIDEDMAAFVDPPQPLIASEFCELQTSSATAPISEKTLVQSASFGRTLPFVPACSLL